MGTLSFLGDVLKYGGVGEAALQAYNYNNDPNNSAGSQYFMGNFVYPSDLVNEDIGRNAYISIKFKSYERRSIFAQPFLRARGGITLPLPSSLQDATSVNWNASTTSAQSAAAGAAIEQLIKPTDNNPYGGASNAFRGSVKDNLSNGNGTDALGAGAAAYGLSTLSDMFGGAGAQLLGLKGLAANPFMTMLFQSPNFKSHSFTWILAPKNAQESATINAIISSFKFNMLPGLSGGGTGGIMFSYPNIADIQLYPSNSYLYKFKPCAVKSVTADFAPNGPSFFRDTFAPTHISLSVEFQEIEMWTKEALTDTPMSGKFDLALYAAASKGVDAMTNSFKDTSNIVKQDNETYPNSRGNGNL